MRVSDVSNRWITFDDISDRIPIWNLISTIIKKILIIPIMGLTQARDSAYYRHITNKSFLEGMLAPITGLKRGILLCISLLKTDKVALIKEQHKKTLEQFEILAKDNKWDELRNLHFDWWMFPVDKDSNGHGSTYKVGLKEIESLKKDAAFMVDYERGVALVLKAWGWDFRKDTTIFWLHSNQCWDGYGVRLAKMSDSLKLFSKEELHRKLKIFFQNHCLIQESTVPISCRQWLMNSFNLS